MFYFTFKYYRFDYGEKFWVIKHKYFTCHCGTEKCRYSKSKITNFLQEYYKRNGEPVPALTDMKSPPQQLAKLSTNNSNGDVVTTDVTTKSKSKSSQNLNQNGNSDENNKKSSEDTQCK